MMLQKIFNDKGEPSHEECMHRYSKKIAAELKQIHCSETRYWRVSLQKLLDVATSTHEILPKYYQSLSYALIDNFFNSE